jgi:hypothetical protein
MAFRDTDWSDIVAAFASQYGYQATINGEPNPQTSESFALAKIHEFVAQVRTANAIRVTVKTTEDKARSDEKTKQETIAARTAITVESGA